MTIINTVEPRYCTATIEPKNIGRINDGFFYKKMYGGFCQAAKKSVRNNDVAVRRGSTV